MGQKIKAATLGTSGTLGQQGAVAIREPFGLGWVALLLPCGGVRGGGGAGMRLVFPSNSGGTLNGVHYDCPVHLIPWEEMGAANEEPLWPQQQGGPSAVH